MRKIFFLTTVLLANFSLAQHREWHVRSYTSQLDNQTNVTGDGTSLLTAWALQNALNNPNGVIQPGDIVWLHGGIYNGRFISNLQGSIANYITVSSYPEEWAVIDGNTPTVAFVPEIYMHTNPCSAIDGSRISSLEEDEQELPMPPENTVNYNDEEGNDILTINGGLVIFKNFEVTCLGQINRILDTCIPSLGFEKIRGIQHNPSNTNSINSKCKFVNLFINNIPGLGIGSWKLSNDTQIYGCIISNNGYIVRNVLCSNPNNVYQIFGKGPGIYTQNSTENIRKIENNFIINNYDSGIFVWSANETPDTDYIKNYEINNNVLLNNGEPGRRISSISNSTQDDSKPNLIIDSKSSNGLNRPTNITINDNIFYINNRGSFISGVRVKNSKNISFNGNYFFKGTTLGQFYGNTNNLNFTNNFYLGKRIQISITPTDYETRNWNFNSNTWYSRDNDGGINSYPKCYQENQENQENQQTIVIRRTINEFRIAYPIDSDQLSNSYRAASPNSQVNFNTNGFGKQCLKTYNGINSPIFGVLNKIVQNIYDTNKFYVTLNNPTLAANRNVIFNEFNIAQGQYYTIRDPQNYSVIIATGNYDAVSGINFQLNLTAFEQPRGFFLHCTEHTYTEISTFIVEFGCFGVSYDRTLQNLTDTTTNIIYAKNNIVLGSNYQANSGSTVIAKAGKQITIHANSHFKSNSNVILKIENTCPDITLVVPIIENRVNETKTETEINKIKEELVLIYPNPSSGIFNLETLNDNKIKEVSISDVNNAKIVFVKKYNLEKLIDIDISKEKIGVYTIQIMLENNEIISKKVIKK